MCGWWGNENVQGVGGEEKAETGIGVRKDCFKIIIIKQTNKKKRNQLIIYTYKLTKVSVVISAIRI